MEKLNSLIKTAEQGGAEAMYELAEHYLKNDLERAEHWASKAVEAGYEDALKLLEEIVDKRLAATFDTFEDELIVGDDHTEPEGCVSAEAYRTKPTEGKIMFTLENREYFKCSKEEKETLVPIIDAIVEIAKVVRAQGLLALEDKIEEMPDYFTRAGMRLLVDGTDPEIVNAMLEIHMVTSYKTGVDLLMQLIIKEGFLSIQAGEHPRYTKEKLYAYLGEDFFGLNKESDEDDEGPLLDTEVENYE